MGSGLWVEIRSLMVASIAYFNAMTLAKSTDGLNVIIMTSVPAVGIHIEKEHKAFPHNDPFHVHHDLGGFRLFELPVPVAALHEELEAFPDRGLDAATAAFNCCFFSSCFHVRYICNTCATRYSLKNILLCAVFCVKMKESQCHDLIVRV